MFNFVYSLSITKSIWGSRVLSLYIYIYIWNPYDFFIKKKKIILPILGAWPFYPHIYMEGVASWPVRLSHNINVDANKPLLATTFGLPLISSTLMKQILIVLFDRFLFYFIFNHHFWWLDGAFFLIKWHFMM
jgi:hypothetical protein